MPDAFQVDLTKEFSFEAAHRLPQAPAGHKCARLHGHSFRVQVTVRGPVPPETGWLMDFADIQQAFAPLREQLDHYYLNEIPGLENPSSENIARWIWRRLEGRLPGLRQITISETCTSRCVYEGGGQGRKQKGVKMRAEGARRKDEGARMKGQ